MVTPRGLASQDGIANTQDALVVSYITSAKATVITGSVCLKSSPVLSGFSVWRCMHDLFDRSLMNIPRF